MTHKFIQIALLALLLLSLETILTPVTGDSGVVAVRILAEEMSKLDRVSPLAGDVIDYGAFIWSTLSVTELANLDRTGVGYQAIENPYVLTLGGHSFDPLVTVPNPGSTWDSQTQKTAPGLHLLQFHGPTKRDWLKALETLGLEIVQYIHPFTYVVWGESYQLEQSKGKAFVRWTGDFLPAYALQPKHRALNSDPILVRAAIYPGAGLSETIQAIEALGGTLISTASDVDPVFDLASFTLPGDRLTKAAALPGIYSLQPVPTDGGDRGEMSNQVNAGNYDASMRAFTGYRNWLNRLDLSGEGVIIANVDSGLDQNHPDLLHRVLGCTGSTCGGALTGNHGTHTAGIMAGDGSSGVKDAYGFLRGLGMAPGADLVEQVYSPTYMQEDGMLTLMTQSHQNGAVISGNSWGPSSTPQGYDWDTRLVDLGVRDAEPDSPGNQALTYVLSIMNGYGGTSTQGTPDEAKNSFTIGSTIMQYSSGAQNLNINNLSDNTAHGPALDGRNIPHLVAPGKYVDSTLSGSAYGLMAGTSMASPHVSGAVALFYERYRAISGADPSPALVKAAFLPVAHDLAGNRDADGNLLNHPFDSKQGWGRLDASEVLDPSGLVYYYDQPVILNNTGEIWKVDISLPEPLQFMRTMLTWTDAPGHGLGGSTPAWVNDLDLSLSFNGNIYHGNNFGSDGFSITGGTPDGKNNTEGIFLPETTSGTYSLTVTAANISGDGVPNFGDNTDQDFALVIYCSYGNKAPSFTSDPVTKATPNVPYTYNIIAFDPDVISGDKLTITTLTKPDWLTLTDNGDGSAKLTGTPTDAHIGDHPVELLVTDSLGFNDTQAFTIIVSYNQQLYEYNFPVFFYDQQRYKYNFPIFFH